MARRIVAAAALSALATWLMALPTHAAEQPTTEAIAAAAEAGVDPLELQGAVNTTGLEPRDYLYAAGELTPPPPPPEAALTPREYLYSSYPDLAPRIACIIQGRGRMPGESNWNPAARNPLPWGRWGEHASGLLQFLPSTMRSLGHPESWVWDPYRSIDAAVEMFRRGRAHEFAGVDWGYC